MAQISKSSIPEILAKHEADLLADWLGDQTSGNGQPGGRIREAELRESNDNASRLRPFFVGSGP